MVPFWICPLAQFRYEEDAEKAVNDLQNRWFNGRPIHAELSPVTDFREACCRQYEMGWDDGAISLFLLLWWVVSGLSFSMSAYSGISI